jgi:hypothetical protein
VEVWLADRFSESENSWIKKEVADTG